MDRNYKKQSRHEGLLNRDRLNSETSCNRSQAGGSRVSGYGRPRSSASMASDYNGAGYDIGRSSRLFSP